jgi:hypothetical protein
VHRELKVLKVLKEHKEHKEHKAHKVHKVIKAHRVHKVINSPISVSLHHECLMFECDNTMTMINRCTGRTGCTR